MDESTYPKLIADIKSCQQGVCDSALITENIKNVFRASGEADGSLKGTLYRWQAMLSSIKTDSTGLNQLLLKLMSFVDSAQVQFEEINDMCKELDSCKGAHVSEFLQKGNCHVSFGSLKFLTSFQWKATSLQPNILEHSDFHLLSLALLTTS